MGSINPDDDRGRERVHLHPACATARWVRSISTIPAFSHRAMLQYDYTRRAEDKIFTA